MAQHLDLHALLGSFDNFEDELKPIDAWRTLQYALEGLPVTKDLPRLEGSPLHQWLEDVANAVDPIDLVEILDRDVRRRVGLAAATSQPAEQLLVSLCKNLELVAWTKGRRTT